MEGHAIFSHAECQEEMTINPYIINNYINAFHAGYSEGGVYIDASLRIDVIEGSMLRRLLG